MVFQSFILFGVRQKIRRRNAVPIRNPEWLDSLERCRKAFGLEKIVYDYWSYPSPKQEGSFWVVSNQRVLVFLSDGFLKVATESQLASMMESLNAENIRRTRKSNLKSSVAMLLYQIKGDSRRYRFWILSFLFYPLERWLKIAKI
jgi:hypothetical protein